MDNISIVSSTITTIVNSNRKVYFDPLWGNNGDSLIELGTRKSLRKLDVILTETPSDAEIVVLNGGGGMTPMWGALDVLIRHIEASPAEIVVLPSSFWPFDALDHVRHVLDRSSVKLTLFARERESHQRLIEKLGGSAHIVLGHDMAFELNAADLDGLRSKARRTRPYALVVERRDAEASTSVAPDKAWRIPLKRFVPIDAKRLVKRVLHRRTAPHTEFARLCAQRAAAQGIGADEIMYSDVSQVSEFSLREFLAVVIDAKIVFTTRLHVAIVRHIVGKPCFLKPTGGEYRKNESVFEHSLKQAGYVRLLEE